MIRVEKLSYGFPEKNLYNDISFLIEEGRHYVLIGSNGTGKSTLADMLVYPQNYNYDGSINIDEGVRIGYAGQFKRHSKQEDKTVFEFLSEAFSDNQKAVSEVCDAMSVEGIPEEEMEKLLARYQKLIDINAAMDGDNYESNIKRQLNIAGMSELSETGIPDVSGGEYKVFQIMKEILTSPDILILDEPDVFLDFANLGSLCRLINEYKGTVIVITHNRYLLNHCFDRVLHLENCELQEFDGNYMKYRSEMLRQKLEAKIRYQAEEEEIERTEEMVDKLRTRASKMVNPVIGRAVNAKQSQLDRLLARRIKAPFIEKGEPDIRLPFVSETKTEGAEEGKPILELRDYKIYFDNALLENVSFALHRGEKVVLVGANGTGKTTLIRDIIKNSDPSVYIEPGIKYECLSQFQGEGIDKLSGGEENLQMIKELADTEAELLILDEPTSHLDIFAQSAFEKALSEYKGAVLMVSHDFYLTVNCADHILLIENNTIRRMRNRKFRKMVYEKYFNSEYLETDRKRQQLEADINKAFRNNDPVEAEKLCSRLEELSFVE